MRFVVLLLFMAAVPGCTGRSASGGPGSHSKPGRESARATVVSPGRVEIRQKSDEQLVLATYEITSATTVRVLRGAGLGSVATQIAWFGQYEQGVPSGKWIAFANERPYLEGTMAQGRPVGVWRKWQTFCYPKEIPADDIGPEIEPMQRVIETLGLSQDVRSTTCSLECWTDRRSTSMSAIGSDGWYVVLTTNAGGGIRRVDIEYPYGTRRTDEIFRGVSFSYNGIADETTDSIDTVYSFLAGEYVSYREVVGRPNSEASLTYFSPDKAGWFINVDGDGSVSGAEYGRQARDRQWHVFASGARSPSDLAVDVWPVESRRSLAKPPDHLPIPSSWLQTDRQASTISRDR